MRRTLALLPLLAALALPSAASAEDIIVKREPGLDRGERLAVRGEADVKLVDTLTLLPDTEVVATKPGEPVGEALAALNANPDVVYAEPDVRVTPASNDTWYWQQWGLDTVRAQAVWPTTRGTGATVAVVDTGIDLTQPDLVGQITGNPGERGNGRETNGIDDDGNGRIDDWRGWDFVNNDNTIETQNNPHGTHVAGTIAALADNALGVAGVAPLAKIIPVKVFGGPGANAPLSTIAQAFSYAGDLGVPVVNASLGGFGTSQLIQDAIASHPNTLYVVAAGNDGYDASFYTPCNAAAANVVCVGATDFQDQPAYFSNFSATAVDLYAPGVNIYSTLPGSGYGSLSGTSMATPHVAGAAALLASARPGETSLQYKAELLGSVDVLASLSGSAVTGGRLDAAAAVAATPAPSPTPTPTPTPTATPTATPTPAPPVVTPPPPVATPEPPVATPEPPSVPQPLVSAVKVTANKLAYTLTAKTTVRFSLLRAGCPTTRGCASGPVAHWSQTSKAGTSALKITRRMGGRKLRPGRYTLVLSTPGGTRSVAIRVR